MKGMFITFEGTEGCGKTTQAELLADYFRQKGQEVLLTREPGGPKIAESIRMILLNKDNIEMLPETELLLYMASRSQHTGEWIIPALKAGKIVISDRYYDSTIAYQGAARKIDRNIIDTIRKYATFGLVPDLTFIIDLPATKGLSRIKRENADRLEQESLEFHTNVRKSFLEIAEEESRFRIINGNKSIEEIHKDVLKIIKEIQEGRDET
ncbi:MAG: thymidylate kinase [Candidatus Cloacimonas sp. SDB]|nr:MAG: thymidylate kinase [Candidatus Cloacimonas sp. SDB]